jgi:methylmalonyl-CoA mutase N-terminal domain/subunit
VIVGVNEYVLDEPLEIPILQMDAQGEQRQVERLSRLRRERDNREAARCLKAVEKACRDEENVMPYLVDAVNACCTLGEICDVMRDVFGAYQEQAVV